MNLSRLSHITCALFLSTFSQLSWAARPFVTDDARLATANHCQLESWMRIYQSGLEQWMLPACNLGDNFEMTLGAGNYQDRKQDYQTQDWVFQMKTLIKPLAVNGWGLGFALGRVMHPDIQPGPNQLGNTYFYIPLSVSFAEDAVVMHFNAGMLHDRQQSSNKHTLGMGGEFALGQRLRGIAEVFGDDTQPAFYQFGLRYAVIPD